MNDALNSASFIARGRNPGGESLRRPRRRWRARQYWPSPAGRKVARDEVRAGKGARATHLAAGTWAWCRWRCAGGIR